MDISFSKWQSFTRCQRAYFYRYELNLERKLQDPKPQKGKLLHECLKAYYLSGGSLGAIEKPIEHFEAGLEKMFDEERTLYADIPSDARRIVQAYDRYWQDGKTLEIVKDKHGKPIIEYKVRIKIADNVVLVLIIDAMVRNNLGVFVMDHKGTDSLPSDDYRLVDAQGALYVPGGKAITGQDVTGVIFNYFRLTPPREPTVLKNGKGLSKAKIDTDKYTYLKAIKENNFDPADYEDMLENLSAKAFFTRVTLEKPATISRQFLREMVLAARRMEKLKDQPSKQFTHTLDRSCDWCEYRPLCIAELLGHDTKFMIDTHYTQRTKETYKEV